MQRERDWQDASMGPVLFRPEDQLLRAVGLEAELLQWGRSYSDRKTNPFPEGFSARQQLQWGRSYSDRKTKCTAQDAEKGTSFNGAGLIQTGRRDRRQRDDRGYKGFNGAGLIQTG